MKEKLFFSLLGALSIGITAHAQTNIKGKLVDRHGRALSDITVSAEQNRTKTDTQGTFSLYVDQKGEFYITVSGIGYKQEEIKITPRGAETALRPITLHRTAQ